MVKIDVFYKMKDPVSKALQTGQSKAMPIKHDFHKAQIKPLRFERGFRDVNADNTQMNHSKVGNLFKVRGHGK